MLGHWSDWLGPVDTATSTVDVRASTVDIRVSTIDQWYKALYHCYMILTGRQMASIGRRFALIHVDQTLPQCNTHQTMSEWRGWRRLTSFDACSTWIDAWSIINQRFSRLRSIWTMLIVDLHRFTSTSCLTLNQPISGLNRRKSTFGGDRDRPEATGRRFSIDRRRSGVNRRRFTSIEVDLGFINVVLS